MKQLKCFNYSPDGLPGKQGPRGEPAFDGPDGEKGEVGDRGDDCKSFFHKMIQNSKLTITIIFRWIL